MLCCSLLQLIIPVAAAQVSPALNLQLMCAATAMPFIAAWQPGQDSMIDWISDTRSLRYTEYSQGRIQQSHSWQLSGQAIFWLQVSTSRQAAGEEEDPAAVVGAAKGRLVRFTFAFTCAHPAYAYIVIGMSAAKT